MLGFGVGAFAMIVILSVFNGFENIVEDLINHYDPEIKITAKGRKTFEYSTDLQSKIRAIEEVTVASQSLEEKVVVKYNDKQEIAKIKGVDSLFNSTKFDSLIVLGSFDLGDSTQNLGVFGGGLANKLNLFPGSQNLVTIFVPNREVEFNSLNPQAALSTEFIRASSVFMLHEEVDNEVFITSLDFAQGLLNYPKSITSLELTLQSGVDPDLVKKKLASALGDSWEIKTRVELNELIYKIFKSEKWLTYAILSLVLIISSFNIFGSLIMLVLDKRKDIGILKSMGAEERTIQKVFLWQGSYIAVLGGGLGVLLAVILVLVQQHIGLLRMENSIVEYYPVELQLGDVILTLLTISILGFLISLYPSKKAAKTEIKQLN